MNLPATNAGYARLCQRLDGDDQLLTPVEAHGLLCALALHPAPPDSAYAAIAGETEAVSADLHELLIHERERIAARLGAGDGVTLPCRLDPYEDQEGQDLASWCTGFMAGVLATRDDWPDEDEEQTQRLLPFTLIAGLDEDPELDALWEQSELTRQMASAIPALLDELFLWMRGIEEGA